MTKYTLIKKADLTNAMLNRSVSTSRESLPVHVSRTYLLWLFPVDTEFYVLEFDPDKAGGAFDEYQWFGCAEIRAVITQNEAR